MSLKTFLLNIQAEIEVTRKAVSRLQERWPDEFVLEFSTHASSQETIYYDYYPHLFLKAFPSIPLADVRTLTLAGRLFARSIMLSDDIMDRTSTVHLTAKSVLCTQAMQLEAYHLLHQLFPPKVVFWERLGSYVVEYTNACIQEQRFASGDQPWQKYTEALALQIAAGKNGITRATIAGLVELAQDDSLLEPLSESSNHLNIAYQMLDDLLDWKEDLRCSLPSLLLARVVHEWPVNFDQNELPRRINHLAREIYYGGHAHYVLELALKSLDRADRMIADMPDLPWCSFIAKLRHRCLALLQDIDRIVDANLRHVRQ